MQSSAKQHLLHTGSDEIEKWRPLARQLKRWGLSGLAAAFMESSGPFATLAAQGLYIGQPILGAWLPDEKIRQFADLLEAPSESAQFVQLLREETP